MTDTFEQKKIEEFEQAWLRSDFGIEDHKSFLLETIRQAKIEGAKESKITFIDRIMEMLEYRYANFYSTEDIRKIIKSTFDLLRNIRNGYSLHSDTKEKEKNI